MSEEQRPTLTFRALLLWLERYAELHDEELDMPVDIRVFVDGDCHIGGLKTIAVDCGCGDEDALILAGDDDEPAERLLEEALDPAENDSATLSNLSQFLHLVRKTFPDAEYTYFTQDVKVSLEIRNGGRLAEVEWAPGLWFKLQLVPSPLKHHASYTVKDEPNVAFELVNSFFTQIETRSEAT
jgi:hypothetical protein